MNKSHAFSPGDYVVYIPTELRHLMVGLPEKMIVDEHLGIVHSVSSKWVFVKYAGGSQPVSTRPEDLYFINKRADLVERLNKMIERKAG